MDFFVGYDISDNKIRTFIFNELKYLGFNSIQKSIFIGLNISEKQYILAKRLFDVLQENDTYFIVKIKLDELKSNFTHLYDEEIVVI